MYYYLNYIVCYTVLASAPNSPTHAYIVAVLATRDDNTQCAMMTSFTKFIRIQVSSTFVALFVFAAGARLVLTCPNHQSDLRVTIPSVLKSYFNAK